MNELKVKIQNFDGSTYEESLYSYCARLSKKNNSVLYKLEDYLGKKLLDEEKLSEIRDIILTVSADISKLNKIIFIDIGDNYEEL